MSTFAMRVLGASVLDRDTYEEVEHHPRATTQAIVVVALASAAGSVGIGAWRFGSAGFVFGAMAASFAAWFAWAMLAYQIGTRVLREERTHANWGQLLRTTGFATAPAWLQVFAILTPDSDLVFSAALLWMTAAMVLALQQALDYQRVWRALAVAAISAALVVLATMGIASLAVSSVF